ncbi:riboflavin synthase [Candidatus Kaiserbacteria bacterium]|nr:riboflavin synthase [Candidatus Kaiserbacteria bacterium]
MFSGIIQKTARISSAAKVRDVLRVSIEKPSGWKLAKGQSISVDGICSTIVSLGKKTFDAEYMPETLTKTTAASFTKGRVVNLERSLRYGDPVDGHFLQGHVETTARVLGIKVLGTTKEMTVGIPKNLRHFIASKGSIAINGVSLTVARKSRATVTFALIPYTLAHTNLGLLKKGDRVNIETDMLARYLATLLSKV